MRRTSLGFVLVLAVLGTLPVVAQASLITNSDFNSGLTGWNTTNVSTTTLAGNVYLGTGTAAVMNTSTSVLYQTISTTAGASYILDFWIKGGGSANTLAVSWGGGPPFTTPFDTFNVNSGTYINKSYTLVAGPGTTTTVAFTYTASANFLAIDHINVDAAASTVPEPATLTLFGIGAFGFAGAALRRRRLAA